MPPGAHVEAVPDPSGKTDKSIELAIFKDHRFAFFFWVKWTRKMLSEGSVDAPPAVVTIDWHRDLAPPGEEERNRLESLDPGDLAEINRFVSLELDPHNDGHLLSAAWLNLVGDIYLLKNYGVDQRSSYTDRDDSEHAILEFRDAETLYSTLLKRNGGDPLYFDIDIDFFVKNKVVPYQRDDVRLYRDEAIEALIDPDGELMGYLFDTLAGMTIATEPRYCGGVRNANHMLRVILDRLFTATMQWRHL